MYPASNYKYFKLVLVFCFIFGSIYGLPTPTVTVDGFQLKGISLTLALFCLQQAFKTLAVLREIFRHTNSAIIYQIVHLFTYCLEITIMVWMVVGTKRIITVLQGLEKLRESTHKSTNPIVFSWLAIALLVVSHASAVVVYPYFGPPGGPSLLPIYLVTVSGNSSNRLCALYSCVYYSCALVVYDTVQEWRHHFRARPPNPGFIYDFCHKIMTQTQLLREINQLHDTNVLSIFCYRLVQVINSGFVMVLSNSPLAPTVINFMYWIVFFGFLILTRNLALEQFDHLKQEVLLLNPDALSRRERDMVRVLLAQLDNKPGEFTSGGFVEDNPAILVTFTSLGIEYLVTMAQNVDALRQLFGLDG